MMSQLITTYTPSLRSEHDHKSIEPFYQGQLDVFCAIYAVLNALKITHRINAVLARNILHEMITELAQQPELFSDVLDQKTDYIFLADRVLASASQIFPIKVERPFMQIDNIPSSANVHKACCQWLDESPDRAIALRYIQYLFADKKPINRHWTTIHIIENDVMHFFDCSHKKNVILQIELSTFTTDLKNISPDCLLYIHPQSIRFIEFAS